MFVLILVFKVSGKVKISLEKGGKASWVRYKDGRPVFHGHQEGTLSELHTVAKWSAQGRLEKAMIAKAV